MNTWVSYENGNYTVKFNLGTGTKIRENDLDFFEGNVVKYISRHREKDGAKDIRKIIDYCQMILKYDYNEE